MSEGDLARRASRPRGMSVSEEERCDWSWERRCWAAAAGGELCQACYGGFLGRAHRSTCYDPVGVKIWEVDYSAWNEMLCSGNRVW